MKKILYGLLLAMLLDMLTSGFYVRQLGAEGTIYIRADGSVDPPTTPIQRNGTLYVFNDTIGNPIVVQKSNIVVDGQGHVLEGSASGTGMSLSNIENVTIRNMTIKTFQNGISLDRCLTCDISGNNITMCFSHGIILTNFCVHNNIVGNDISLNKYYGIYLIYSSNNSISGNTVTANSNNGIVLLSSQNDSVVRNNITANTDYGIAVVDSSNNNISRNNIVDNYGLGLESTSKNDINGNIITDNEHGVVLLYSQNDSVVGNNITANKYYGVFLGSSLDNTVGGNNITANYNGIYLDSSSNNRINGNNIAANEKYGINPFNRSDYNNIFKNNIINNWCGIGLQNSSDTISENNIETNSFGIRLQESSSNKVYRNNFLNNTDQAYTEDSANFWDDGYPSGGNYWSNYEGRDQNGDGIGDTPYVIDANNTDRYPLIVPHGPIPVFWKQEAFDFLISGNMTVARFGIDPNKTIGFKAIGQGYVNLEIPREYSDGFFKVLVNDTQVPCMSSCNDTYTSIYFECRASSSNIVKIEAQMKFLGDINGDGAVNIIDISIVAKHFGQKLNP